jgi:hypothetical protein
MPRAAIKIMSPAGMVLTSLAKTHGLEPEQLAIKSSIAADRWSHIVTGQEQITQHEVYTVAEALDRVRRERALKTNRTIESIRESLLKAAGYVS